MLANAENAAVDVLDAGRDLLAVLSLKDSLARSAVDRESGRRSIMQADFSEQTTCRSRALDCGMNRIELRLHRARSNREAPGACPVEEGAARAVGLVHERRAEP